MKSFIIIIIIIIIIIVIVVVVVVVVAAAAAVVVIYYYLVHNIKLDRGGHISDSKWSRITNENQFPVLSFPQIAK